MYLHTIEADKASFQCIAFLTSSLESAGLSTPLSKDLVTDAVAMSNVSKISLAIYSTLLSLQCPMMLRDCYLKLKRRAFCDAFICTSLTPFGWKYSMWFPRLQCELVRYCCINLLWARFQFSYLHQLGFDSKRGFHRPICGLTYCSA